VRAWRRSGKRSRELHGKSKLQPHGQGPAASPIGGELAGECLKEQDCSMTDEPENLILRQLREMRAEMREGFAGVNQRFDKLEAHIAASDAENAKILETITHDIADLKTIFVDLQARVVRDEKRLKALEKARPDA